jgi:hypothetical protein
MKTKKFHHGKLKHLFSQFEGDTDLQEIGPFALPPFTSHGSSSLWPK